MESQDAGLNDDDKKVEKRSLLSKNKSAGVAAKVRTWHEMETSTVNSKRSSDTD